MTKQHRAALAIVKHLDRKVCLMCNAHLSIDSYTELIEELGIDPAKFREWFDAKPCIYTSELLNAVAELMP